MTEIQTMDIKSLFENFNEHILVPKNKRIFFSGKFGTGKSYFLNQFFEQEELTKKYEIFHLCPVKYQINSNEDIFEYIKYDLLINLKEKNIIFEQNDFGNILGIETLLSLWLPEHKMDISKTVLSYFGKLGEPLEKTLDLMNDFSKFYKEMSGGNKKKIDNFMKNIEKKHPKETDSFSQLIKEKIDLLKGDRESILIIDDLDRLDPEHVFRLLNIFSAHFYDDSEDGIKFGFDKIILVGDIENLKSIFFHKYGLQADFSGYIDKFYSTGVYHFSTQELLSNFVKEVLKSSKYNIQVHKNSMAEQGYLLLFLSDILIRGVNLNKRYINIRNILRPHKYAYPILQKSYSVNDDKAIFDIGIYVLIDLLGGKEECLGVLNEILENHNNVNGGMPIGGYKEFGYIFLKWTILSERKKVIPDTGKITYLKCEIDFSENEIHSCSFLDVKGSPEIETNIQELFFLLVANYIKKNIYKKGNKFFK